MPAASAKRRIAKATAAPKRRTIGRPRSAFDSVGRETLIDVACHLLKELPPEKVTRAGVARRSGVDPSLIRYYFNSQSSLLVAAAERVTNEFNRILERKLAACDRAPLSRLMARIAAMLEMHLAYPFFNRLVTEHVLNSGTPDARSLFRELVRRSRENYTAIVDDGVAAGVMRPVDPVLLSVAIVGLCEQFAAAGPILREAFGKRLSQAELVQAYLNFVGDMVVRGVGAKR